MRVNDKALAELSTNIPVIEGRLHHKRANPGNFAQGGFKERWYKLISNILFSFYLSDTGKIYEKKPISAMVLENSFIQFEKNSEAPFAFSITFKDELDKKHIFSGRSEEYVNQWIQALKGATYEYWRSQLLKLQYQISYITGQDPLLMVPRNNVTRPSDLNFPKTSNRSSFQSYMPPPSSYNRTISRCFDNSEASDTSFGSTEVIEKNYNGTTEVPVDNLISFDENHFGSNSVPVEVQPKTPPVNVPVRLAPPPPVRPPRSPKVNKQEKTNLDLIVL